MPAPERFDTVIIGAGMSGLAAGIRLAQYDQRVLVVERHALWGGLNSFYKLGGHRLDVGLHALTNYVPAGTRGTPLARILRQLRMSHADLELGEQLGSEVVFPGSRLRWTNGLGLLEEEVAREFPGEVDGFRRLVADLSAYPDSPSDGRGPTARAVLAGYLSEPRLVDMLLLPVLYYGSPTPRDIGWDSFVILFKSLYEEGFARPRGGVRTILDLLRGRYRELGGELRMRCGVELILSREGRVSGLVLEDGSELACERVLSSAGWVETLRLAGLGSHERPGDVGSLSFVESISILDRPSRELGFESTICFFNTVDELVYARPEEPVDYRSGVICCPDSYAAPGAFEEPALRLTLLADHGTWSTLPDERYYPLKDEVWERGHAVIAPYGSDVRPHTVFRDLFTPRTIEHYTGHLGGAVYGCPEKRPGGETPLRGLALCGTDQGFLGIVGAMLSGIAMANRHALVPA